MRSLTVLVLLVLGAAAVAQQPEPVVVYDAGRLGFDYAQTPYPFYSGSFAAEGEALAEDGTLPPGQTEAVGGGIVPMNADSMQTALYAVTDNGDGTYDFALAAVATEGLPEPGTYPVDLTGGTAVFGYVDDATSFDLPDTLDQDHLMDWLTSLEAAHKLISTSGSITLAGVDADTLHGTFGGTTVDMDNVFFVVEVTDGQFALSGEDVVSAAPPAAPAAVLRVAPNPFNPRTEIRFALAASQAVQARVYDAAGRLVRTLHDGPLAAGPHRLAWDGRDARGGRVAAGTYLVRVAGAHWRDAAKVTLMP